MKMGFNILWARFESEGKLYHISHCLETKEAKCWETNKCFQCGRREFRKRMKLIGATIQPQLKLGEYISVNTGKVEKLFGIE